MLAKCLASDVPIHATSFPTPIARNILLTIPLAHALEAAPKRKEWVLYILVSKPSILIALLNTDSA